MNDKERDNNLLRRIKTDPEVFVELYDQYYFEILNFMYYRTGHRQTAEDLTSDVFHNAFGAVQKIHRLKRPFYAWLYTIARNRLYSYFRKKKSLQLDSDLYIEDPKELVHEHLLNNEDHQERTEVLKKVHEHISRLPERYHEVITLFYYEEFSVRKIAEHLDISESAVKTRLSRAREVLRKNI